MNVNHGHYLIRPQIWLYSLAMLCGFMVVPACQQPVATPTQIVQSLQTMQQLATLAVEVSKVVKAADNQTWYKFGDRKILITCRATLKAGIDLGQLQPKDVSISGKKITIILPEPKVLQVNILPENIQVAHEDIDIFRSRFSGAEIDGLMAQAEKQMMEAGQELGIAQQARVNTQLALSRLLQNLGFEEVELRFEQPKKLPLP